MKENAYTCCKYNPIPPSNKQVWRARNGKGHVNKNVNKWFDWQVAYVPKPIKSGISNAFSKVKSSILRSYDGANTKLNNSERSQFNAWGHKTALKATHKCFWYGGFQNLALKPTMIKSNCMLRLYLRDC